MRIDKKIEVPQSVIDIKNIFKDNGHDLFVVGGAVRDSLLNEKPKDFDLATDAVPDKIKSMLASKYRFLEIGESFGVVFVLAGEDEFEIATFREESGYSDSRRPDDVKFSTIEKDVERRDLSINALFYDIDKEQIVDLVGGVKDLKGGIIRTVGKAKDRFTEDRLRVLRAIRFACRLDFRIDQDITDSIIEDNNLELVSKERIRNEFLACLKSTKSIHRFRDVLSQFDLDGQIFPGLILGDFPLVENKDIQIALALKDNVSKKLRKSLNQLTYTGDEVTRVCFLIESMALQENNAFLMKKAFLKSKVSKEEFALFHKLLKTNSVLVESFNEFELSVTGDRLMEDGFTPGPALGEEIKKRELNNFKQLLKTKEA